MKWPYRVWKRPGRCNQMDIGYYHNLGKSMPCLRRAGHWLAHRNQWNERWR